MPGPCRRRGGPADTSTEAVEIAVLASDSWTAGDLVGPPEQVREKLRTCADLGCEGVLRWVSDDPETETLRLFTEQVVPALRCAPRGSGRASVRSIGGTVGDLGRDTAVVPVADRPGRFTAVLSPEWEIWGPMGGYVAGVALRAAGAASRFERPASFACQYLGVADFATVDVEVVTLRSGRTAEAFRVSITQPSGDGRVRRILEALVWATAQARALDHDDVETPDVPGPDELPAFEDLVPDDAPPAYPFWSNLDQRVLSWHETWPPAGPVEPRWRQWLRFRPTGTWSDPWIDAVRAVMLVDIVGWPSGHRPHAWREPEVIAPNLDLYVAFHRQAVDEPWLLADGHSHVGADGLIGYTGRVWTTDRRLVASGGGQLLCRPAPPA